MTIGERIRNLRIEMGLTQKQLGERCGMADSAIRRYESNRGNPTMETLERIASALDIHVMKLLNPSQDSFRRSMDGIILAAIKDSCPSEEDLYNALLAGSISIVLLDGDLDHQLFAAYHSLNKEGQSIAVECIQKLSDMPQYKNAPPQD